jgi:hypothetical protein
MSVSVRAPRWKNLVRCCLALAVLAGIAVVGPIAADAMFSSAQPATVGRSPVRSGAPISYAAVVQAEGNYQANWQAGAADGWSNEASGDVERFADRGTHLECHAGGDSAGTHYARVRRKLPERDDVAIQQGFSIEADFELPSNFYDRHESYMRVVTAENTQGKYRSSGQSIGTDSSDEWRLGFAIYAGDGLFRLISDHQNHENIILWTAAQRLPTGRHVVRIEFVPSRATDGAWALHIDGERVGGEAGVRTVPTSVDSEDVVVTRVGGCVDGASKQDNRSVQVNLFSLSVRAQT